jgi:hypothetical protein
MTEPIPMREIHEIREKIYEEEKNLSNPERLRKIHAEAARFIEKYGLKFKAPSVRKVA